MTNNKIQVHGIAIRPGISRNGIMYSAEELVKFGPTLSQKPILKDHRSAVDNTVGVVEYGTSGPDGIVNYHGWIKEDGTGLLERIQDGRAKEVSIGATVGKLVKENEDSDVLIATDLHAMELSITPTPGIIGTSIQQSLESFEKNRLDKTVKVLPIAENINDFSDYSEKKVKEVVKMSDEMKEKEQTDKVTEEIKPEVKEEVTNSKESVHTVKLKVDTSAYDQAIEKAEKLVKLQEKLNSTKIKENSEEVSDEDSEETEQQEDENMEENVKDGLKGKVSKEAQEDVAGDFVVESSSYGDGVALWKQPKADGRLI